MPVLTPGDLTLSAGAGAGQYLVGVGQPFPSIQAAIDALVDDQGAEPFDAEQRITIMDGGVYEPFRIESDALTPTESARLVIEGGPGVLPVISGRKNPSRSGVGGLIGNNVPNVTLQRLFFRDLIKGTAFGVNSHRAIVNACMFMDCGNAGVWFYQSDECLLSNSIVVNCDHGMAATKVKSVGVLHNTFFNDSKVSRDGKKTYCLFIDLQDDRGQGEEDTGLAHVYNNIVYSRADFGILVYEKDLKNLRSDWNNLYCPTIGDEQVGGGVAEIRERHADGVVSREFIRRLNVTDVAPSDRSWRMRSGQDSHSISDDPGFFKPASDAGAAKIDLSLMPSSPILGKGALLYDLPSWIDSGVPLKDFDLKARMSASATCAIGALETAVSDDFFDDLVFGDTNDPTQQLEAPQVSLDECGSGTVTPIDKALAHYAHAIPIWAPQVHQGPFFVRDGAYHLFVKKKALYVRDIQRTTFPLSALMTDTDATVLVAGQDVTATASWRIEGYTFTLHHSGIEDVDESTEVELQGYQRTWDDDAGQFGSVFVRHRWKISEGVQRYALPDNPVLGEPIVVTDDLLAPGNVVGLRQEFRTLYDSELDETLLEFAGPRNLWANSDFSYVDDEPLVNDVVLASPFTGFLPRDHEIQGDAFLTMPAFRTAQGLDFAPLRGVWSMLMGTGDLSDYMGQRVVVDPTRAYTFSAYAASMETGIGASFRVGVSFIDRDGAVLAEHGPYDVPLEMQTPPDVEWLRFGFSFYGEPDTTLNRSPFSADAYPVNTGLDMPADTHEALLKIYPGTGLGYVALDAFQVAEGYRPGLYTRIPKGKDLTVEYETEDLRFHKIEDLSIQPVHNAQARGFLAIMPIPARQWDPDAPAQATTLSDYQWPWGRVNLLPWARTAGFNKYRHTPWFSTSERSPASEPISPAATPALPDDINIYPSTVYARQGSPGELLAIEVFDEDTNPYAFERARVTIFDNTGEFPGYLARKEWGSYTHLGQRITVVLNEAGTASLRWIPPEPDQVSYHGPMPTGSIVSVAGVDKQVGFIDTYYEVYRPNHGSVVVLDDDATPIVLEGDPVTGSYLGQVLQDQTVVQLLDFPVPGSVLVEASFTGEAPSTRLPEAFSSPVPDRHFLVDYENGRLILAGAWEEAFAVAYRPRLAWVDPSFPRRIYFDGVAIESVTGDIVSVHYDAVVQMTVEAFPPTGMAESVKQTFLQVDLVAQHAERSVL